MAVAGGLFQFFRNGVFATCHRLAVYNAGARSQLGYGLDNQRKAFGQIIAGTAVELHPLADLAGDNADGDTPVGRSVSKSCSHGLKPVLSDLLLVGHNESTQSMPSSASPASSRCVAS